MLGSRCLPDGSEVFKLSDREQLERRELADVIMPQPRRPAAPWYRNRRVAILTGVTLELCMGVLLDLCLARKGIHDW